MKRRSFITASAIGLPALTLGETTTAPAQRTDKGFVVKARQSRFNESTKLYGTSPNDIKISGQDTNGQLTVFEYTGNEKGGPPLHIHPNQDEIFFILEGDYLFQVGSDTHRLQAGDTIFLPRNVPHTFAQTSAKGKMTFLFQPSGKMEDYFRAIAALKQPPTPEQGAKIFADHDMQVVGPPLKF